MMWFIKALLLILQIFSHTLVLGLNCTDQCCYYYHGVPKNVTTMQCNPEGSTITWNCQVYSPHDPGTNLSVKWYRSMSEVSAREEGELITKRQGKYSFSALHASSAVNDSQSVVNGLFLDVFRFAINNFDGDVDGGYYWCQMVINDTTCLQPSNIGFITPNSLLTRNCNFNLLDFIEFEMPQVCARRSKCIREAMTEAMPVTSTQGQNTNSVLGTTPASNSTFESSMMTVVLYAVIGVMAFIIVLLLLIIMAFTVHTIRNRRMFEIKQKHDQDLDVKDTPHQLVNVYSQFTQTDDGKEIIQRAETQREPAESLSDGHSPQQPVASAPPPSSRPPQPPTPVPPPTDKSPQPTNYNPKSLSRSSSKGDEGNYAYPGPVQRQFLKSRDATKSSPALTGQYQDIRVSRLDYVPMYNVATNAKKTNIETKDDLDSKTKPSYVNLAS